MRSTLVEVEVVVLAKDIGGDNGCEVAAVLLIVHAVLNIHEPLRIGIALQRTCLSCDPQLRRQDRDCATH